MLDSVTDNVVGAWTNAPAFEPGNSTPVTLIEGATFCICGPGGEIRRDRAEGLFVRDTRILSEWRLTLDGLSTQQLSVQSADPFSATFVARVPPHPGHADSRVLVLIHRYIGNGMREDLELHNHSSEPTDLTVALTFNADFADLFEVKEGRVIRSPTSEVHMGGDGDIEIGSAIDGRRFALTVRSDACAERVSANDGPARELRWQVTIPPRASWSTSLEFAVTFDGETLLLSHPLGQPVEHAIPAGRMKQWRAAGPTVTTADPNLAAVLDRSVIDLGSLRIFDPDHPDRAVIAAGAPWFMALFGRDSLLTSWMVLPLDEQLAIGTLQTLAEHQGRGHDTATEEQPGRILHEVRFGHAARLALGGGTAYFGTVDATPLFVMLLAEVRRWSRATAEVTALLPNADRALDWIENYGDVDQDGFVEYHRRNSHGLANQGWKDSFDGINFADGTLAQSPIALAEVQGYTYAAYLARAELAEDSSDYMLANRLRTKAAALKVAFNEAFWLPTRKYFAVGLDVHKHAIDAVTSNLGHCLWTGIVDDDKAEAVADRLMAPDMFSGWGIRTLSAEMGAYNPMSYHNGSVWPHDNAICAAGLARYGFAEQAHQVASAIIDASAHFGHRLPELICGFDRSEFSHPIAYPTSCSPQAWSSAAPLLLLRTMLRIEPSASRSRVTFAHSVPRRFLPLTVDGLRIGSNRVSLRFDDTGHRIDGLSFDL